ncbi:MAG: hypothetical protein EPN34_06115 [Burkholderiaceae bacterium]|nr:MAG: hypothetical protein EPN34_06115 [Burkholderiaceae bacterium]
MNEDLHAAINDDAERTAKLAAERAAEIAAMVAGAAKAIQAGKLDLENFSPSMQNAIKKYTARNLAVTPQQFHAKQHHELAKFFRELRARGFKVYRTTQRDHDYIFGSIPHIVDSGTRPAVKPMLREYAEQQGYPPEWAERVATKSQPKKMGRSLKTKQAHPVIRDLKEGHMFTQTHQAALKQATYSGIAELLFSGSQSAREKRAMNARMAALETELATVKAAAHRANTRLNIMDAGLDWKEKVRSILAMEPSISKRELARRVGKSESAVRKYWTALDQGHGIGATA